MVASHSTAYFSSLKGNLSSNIYEMKLKEWKVFSSPLSHILKKIFDFNTFICRIYPSLMLRCKVMFECWALEEKKLTIFFILCVCLFMQWPTVGAGWCAEAISSKFDPTVVLTIASFHSTRTSLASAGSPPARKHQKQPVCVTRLICFFISSLPQFCNIPTSRVFRQICKLLLALFFN